MRKGEARFFSHGTGSCSVARAVCARALVKLAGGKWPRKNVAGPEACVFVRVSLPSPLVHTHPRISLPHTILSVFSFCHRIPFTLDSCRGVGYTLTTRMLKKLLHARAVYGVSARHLRAPQLAGGSVRVDGLGRHVRRCSTLVLVLGVFVIPVYAE